MSADNWAIVAATFLGPIAAVGVSIWRERRNRSYDRQLWVFRTLMATRRMHLSNDHVTALNQIELEFRANKEVQQAWADYHAHIEAGKFAIGSDEYRKWDAERIDILAQLIASIGTAMGFKYGELQIKKGGYAPEGWAYRDARMGEVQELVRDLLRGNRALRVTPVNPAPPMPSIPPPPNLPGK
jgi:hypothetical protein